MIRVLLQGRLGNHLFQIATALALAQKHSTGIIVDSCLMPNVTGGISFRREPVMQLKFPRRHASVAISRLHRAFFRRHAHETPGKTVHCEPSHSFDPAVASLPDGAVLIGYFQNERYFDPIAATLPQLFDFTPWLKKASTTDQAAVLQPGETIGLHVRRDDYQHNAQLQVCGLSYYERAIARLRESFPDARLVIFSDDIAWCRLQFARHQAAFVDNRHHPYGMLIDLALLSACRHQIIANSSFSWWAAWLNPNPARHVLMPDRWTLDDTVPIQTKHMRGTETVSTAD